MLKTNASIFSLRTQNLDTMVGFYRNLLGKPTEYHRDKWATFNLPGSQLIVWKTHDQLSHTAQPLQLCLEVEDIDATHKWIKAYSLPSDIESSSHGREFTISDPDVNSIILYQPQ